MITESGMKNAQQEASKEAIFLVPDLPEQLRQPEANPFQNFSQVYWQSSLDLLHEDSGIIAQYFVDNTGRVVASDSEAKHQTVTVAFDGRDHRANNFIWQVSLATLDPAQRTILQVSSKGEGRVFKFDPQGRLSKNVPMPSESVEELGSSLMRLVTLPVVTEYAAAKRVAKQKSIADLGSFIRNQRSELGRELFNERLKKKQELAERIGFAATKAYSLPGPKIRSI